MEKLSRYSEISEIIPADYSAPYFLFPVRHHSPVCSWHLKKVISEYRPEIILIEGPCTANDLIPVLTDEKTVLPVAFYYFYKDTKGYVSEEKEDYKCYYPFLFSSPEYNALTEAKRMGIDAEFIDLPYYEILINSAENTGMRSEEDGQCYSDDRLISKSNFYSRISEKTGLRDFEEFWEKYFEINGMYISTEQFIKQMHTYCMLTRKYKTDEEIINDGTAVREQYMAEKAAAAMEKYSRVLIVTGGFHSKGIYDILNSDMKPKSVEIHRIPDELQGCFPMAYSYEASSSLRGYRSGMKCPGFYDTVMKKLNGCDSPQGIYDEVSMDILIKTAKKSAAKDIAISVSDITSAHTMMTGLSALRNCRECGIYEVSDAVTSCFIKGEKTVSSSLTLFYLTNIAEGQSIGHIGDKTHVPPLITDFEKICKELGIKHRSVVPSVSECQLFTSKKGIRTSRFFHRLDFLGTGFAQMTKGPNLHLNKDRSRVREEWKYRRTPNVDAVLTDHTTDGFTIEEACSAFSSRKINSATRCSEASGTAVDCFLMGIPLHAEQKLNELIASDGDIFSVAAGLRNFKKLYELQKLYSFEDSSSFEYIEKCYHKLISAIPGLSDISPDNAAKSVEMLKLTGDTAVNILDDEKEKFFSSLKVLAEAENKEPEVFGAVMGLLSAEYPEYRIKAQEAMSGYLKGSTTIKKYGAEYLKGLFSTARDIVFFDEEFLRMTDSLITSIDYDDFLEILPSIRLAFSNFTPSEIKKCSSCVAEIHKTDKDDILDRKAVDEHLSDFGRMIDEEICRITGREDLLSENR